MPRIQLLSFALTAVMAVAFAGCSSDTSTNENTGSLNLSLELADGTVINEVDWRITGNGMDMDDTINVSAPGSTASVEVYGLPPGEEDYTITLSAVSVDGDVTCEGSEDFNVEVGETTDVKVILNCKLPRRFGSVRVNGEFNICAELLKMVVSPLVTSIGSDIDLQSQAIDRDGDDITTLWSNDGGVFDDPTAESTTYTCLEVGIHLITVSVTDNDEVCDMATWTVPVECVPRDGLECVDDEDCDKGEMCVDNECVPDLECIDNEGCDLGEICFDNECRADPDIFCDTGLCADDPGLRADCVGAFLGCLEDNIDEEECVLLSLLICNEPACSDVIDFEDACGPYIWDNFGGGVATVVENPDSSGINTTAKVAQMQKFAGEVYGGSTLFLADLGGPVDWTKGTAFTMKVWSSRAVPVLFKLEGLFQERSATQTGSSSWEELCYDFTGTTGGDPATAITFIFDLGTSGDALNDADNWTFFFDGIVQTDGCGGGVIPGDDIAINGGFETGAFNDGSPDASWQQFPNGGTQAITTDNPSAGTFAANLVIPVRSMTDPAVDNLIKNANLEAGNLTPGQSITVTWDMRGSLSGAGGVVFAELFSEFSGGGATNEIYTGAPIFPAAAWESFTWNTTLGADVSGGVTLQLKAGCGAVVGCGADVYFDNVTITVP
jgi:hypothetical protein